MANKKQKPMEESPIDDRPLMTERIAEDIDVTKLIDFNAYKLDDLAVVPLGDRIDAAIDHYTQLLKSESRLSRDRASQIDAIITTLRTLTINSLELDKY